MSYEYIVHPEFLASKVKQLEGFDQFIGQKASEELINELALEEAEELAGSWPEGHGFGSSDTTASIHSVARSIVWCLNLQEQLELVYNPYLSIIRK